MIALSLATAACQPPVATVQPTLVAPTQPAIPSKTPVPHPVIVPRVIKENLQQPIILIEARYPYLEKATDSRFALFNKEVERLVTSLIADFKINFKPAGIPADPASMTSFMEIDYEVTYGLGGYLSVRFIVDVYFAGAAHPNLYYQTLTLDITGQRNMTLADLFNPEVDFIKEISDYCLKDLSTRKVLEFEGGAQPKPENFQNWNLTETGLLVSFDPYQVGPYAMGPQAVTIPYNNLKSILKPEIISFANLH